MSAFIAPFISSALYILRLTLMKGLFRLLYAEACHKDQPIVYLAHPGEWIKSGSRAHYRWSELSPKTILVHGLKFRRFLYADRKLRLDLNRALFSYIATFPNIRFMTMREYALSHCRC